MMYDELIKNLRKMQSHEYCVLVSIDGFPAMQIVKQAADAIEEVAEERDMYIKAMADEHNRAARLAWEHRWIPVTERLPEEDTSCLVFLVGGEFSQLSWMSMAIFYNGVFRYDDHSGEFDQITHWMPLPEPPEKEDIFYHNECEKKELQKRKRGKWIDYKCSNCGYSAVIRVERDGDVVWESTPMNFCPNCGADMRGDSDV